MLNPTRDKKNIRQEITGGKPVERPTDYSVTTNLQYRAMRDHTLLILIFKILIVRRLQGGESVYETLEFRAIRETRG